MIPSFAIPTRFWLGCMTFCATMIVLLIQSNLVLSMIAMTMPANTTDPELVPDLGPRYAYTPYEQSLIIGAVAIGRTIGTVPVMLLVNRFDCVRSYMLWMCAVSALLVGATPLIAWSVGWLFAAQLILGAIQGATFPLMHKLFDRWAPPDELGKFTATLMGASLGTIVSWSVSGLLIESYGWPASFYGVMGATLVFCVLWWAMAFDSPAEHPRIATTEREYIERCLVGVSRSRTWPPLLKILTSIPVWSMILLHFGNMWGVMFVLNSGPKFLNEFLGFSVANTGLIASLPDIAHIMMANVFGLIGDWMRRKRWVSLICLRRFFTIFSHLIPGLLVASIPFAGKNPIVCVALLTTSFGFDAAKTVTTYSIIHDIAPNFSGSIIAVANTISSTSGFLSPLVVAYFTSNKDSIDGWRSVFLIGGAAYILPIFVFMIFGSASVQPWNQISKGDDGDQTHLQTLENGKRVKITE